MSFAKKIVETPLSSLKEIKLKAQLDQMTKSEDFIFSTNKEFKELIHYILNIEEKSKTSINDGSLISFHSLVQGLIKLMDINVATLSEEMIIVSLKLFKKIIELENLEITKNLEDWDSNDFNMKGKKIEERQNQLVKTGIVKMLYNLISSEKSSNVIYCFFF